MAEYARHTPASPSTGPSESIGDVLASIRRLIAQDETNCVPEAMARRFGAYHASRTQAAPHAQAEAATVAPLVLGIEEAAPVDDAQVDTDPAPSLDPVSAPTTAFIPATQHQAPVVSLAEATQSMQTVSASSPAVLHPNAAPMQTPFTEPMHQLPSASVNAPAAVQQPVAQPSGDDFNLFMMDEPEAALNTPLNGLIRDALQQELRGEFGDRFTRNLRHLIRSEIAFALKEATRVA